LAATSFLLPVSPYLKHPSCLWLLLLGYANLVIVGVSCSARLHLWYELIRKSKQKLIRIIKEPFKFWTTRKPVVIDEIAPGSAAFLRDAVWAWLD
jgi:hypothetical protein